MFGLVRGAVPALVFWLIASCDSESAVPARACAPGQQIACGCGGPVVGYQVCVADGSSYGTCICTDTGSGGSADASATGGSSAAGAAGAAGSTSSGGTGAAGANSGGAGAGGAGSSGGADGGGGSAGDSGPGDTGTFDGSVDDEVGVACGPYFCDAVCCLKYGPFCVGGSTGKVCGGTPQQNIGCDGNRIVADCIAVRVTGKGQRYASRIAPPCSYPARPTTYFVKATVTAHRTSRCARPTPSTPASRSARVTALPGRSSRAVPVAQAA